MKIFIIQTNTDQIILTLKYYTHNQTFRIFLHKSANDTTCDGVAFYEIAKSSFIKPNRMDLFKTAKSIIMDKFEWSQKSQNEFRSFLYQISKECHPEFFNKDGELFFLKYELPTDIWLN